mmetsp:Transcript_28901/g.81390  ORF Transcript_28901/g.81390 Transcript_28901/m.81390 type:complete len:118 (+) Transcript_28901:187-540(+)
MGDFNPSPYRGDPKIPHVNERFFKVYFAAANVGLALVSFPGRLLGTEVRPRRHNRDYIIACCDEAARAREMRRGKPGRQWTMAPVYTEESYEKMWYKHLHHRRWVQERMGPLYPPTV